jgi:hypothetical protein
MRGSRIALLALAAFLVAGCGDINRELDNANKAAGIPGGNSPPPAQPAPGDAKAADAKEKESPSVIARVQGMLGMGDPKEAGHAPKDPNDPMVVCRLGGSTSFMLKSGCLNRLGTVVSSKGVPK